MPFATVEGVRLHWRADGHPGKPALLCLNSLGTDLAMWDAVLPRLTVTFRVIRMDARGHGASDAPEGDYTIPMLAEDALAVLDAAGAGRAHLCGLSMGGMIALHLAATAPDRVARVVACNTSAAMPSGPWLQRAALVREQGLGAIVDMIMGRWFSQAYRARDPAALATARSTFLQMSAGGYAGCCAAIAGLDLADRLPAIGAPVLVINGSLDEATPPDHGDRIAAAIPSATTVTLPAAHLSAIETPAVFAQAVTAFLQPAGDDGLATARETLFAHGLDRRRAVLGDAWVDKALAGRNAFSGEFQELITRYAWGEIWTRPGLDDRTRRLLVLAVTIALGRWEEFRLHVRAGTEQDGFTLEELRETIMQCAVYAGVPAANTGFHHAEDVLRQLGKL